MTPLAGQPHPNRAAVDLAALVVHIAHIHQFFQVIADVAALIVAAAFQLSGGDFIVADVEQQQRLHGVDVQHADAFEFILDHVQQQAVQPFNQPERIEVALHESRL